MGNSLIDLFRAETEFDVKASEMYGLMREAVKAEFLLNAAKCDVPSIYARQIATGEKEETPFIMAGIDLSAGKDWTPGQNEKTDGERGTVRKRAAGRDVKSGAGSVGIVRKHEQRVEWIDIQDIIRKGRAGVSLPPGTGINFTLKNGDPAFVVVVGVDHYEKGDCVFWFRRIVGRSRMNYDDVNEYGLQGSNMRKYINEKIFPLLPDDLQDVIKPHTTIQKIEGAAVESVSDALFPPSTYEICGENIEAEYNELDKQFEFFKERKNRIAYDENGDPCEYWTADPSAADGKRFCIIEDNGKNNIYGASGEEGAAPLFIIK